MTTTENDQSPISDVPEFLAVHQEAARIGARPIRGGFCLHRVDARRCVDVMAMAYNWRVVLTERRPDPEDPHELAPPSFDSHDFCEILAGWCYYGHGTGEDGRERTYRGAFLAAMAAAHVFTGEGEPAGYQKRAL